MSARAQASKSIGSTFSSTSGRGARAASARPAAAGRRPACGALAEERQGVLQAPVRDLEPRVDQDDVGRVANGHPKYLVKGGDLSTAIDAFVARGVSRAFQICRARAPAGIPSGGRSPAETSTRDRRTRCSCVGEPAEHRRAEPAHAEREAEEQAGDQADCVPGTSSCA